MDENRNLDELTGDEWLASFLAAKQAGQTNTDDEIGVDEQAVFAAGLTHPDDLELEKILQEVHAEQWAEEHGTQPEEEDDVKEYDPSAAVVIPTEEFKDEEFRDTFGEGEALEKAFSNEPEAEPEQEEQPQEQEEAPVEKRRPKKKREYWLWGLPQLASSFIWLAVIVTIGVTIGRIVWMCASDVLALSREPITATVTIEEGDDMDAIADKLKEAGLIRYPGLFKLYADITDAQEKIIPGTYVFKAQSDSGESMLYDYMAVVTVLSPHQSSLVVVEDLRIPEGYTSAQIYDLLESKKICSAADMEHFLTVQRVEAEEGKTLTEAQKEDNALVSKREKLFKKYWFLEGETLEGKYALEGYLFPDTYDFYENDDPARVIEKMLNAFKVALQNVRGNKEDNLAAVRTELNEWAKETMKKNGFSDAYIEEHEFSMRDIIIIASMIEKESANGIDSFAISSVMYNRLTNAKKYPTLNVESALVYALGRQEITDADKADETNPYNTYKNGGLPPTPICNPSLNSLAAALDPEETVKTDAEGNPVLDKNGNTTRVYYYFYAYNPETYRSEFFQTEKAYNSFVESLKEKA